MINPMSQIKCIDELEITNQTLFLRLDLNVPIKNGVITDDTRITESLPTIKYALENRAKIILASHLGRPKTSEDKEYSLLPVGQKIAELLNIEVILTEDYSSDFMKPTLSGLTKNQVILFENLRFNPGETKNDDDLAKVWADYCQVYVNDAFGASHRAHASTHALPKMMKQKACGFLIKKELDMLGLLLDHPKTPYLAILGGAKVSDKIKVIENLIDRVDTIIIGGAMGYTFLKAQNIPVGKSLVEPLQVGYARELIARFESRNKNLLLPVDHVVVSDLNSEDPKVTQGPQIEENFLGVDIGPKTINLYKAAVNSAKTVFWNGPMGIFENPLFSKGTFGVAQALANNTEALRIIGGGDSAAAANQAGISDQLNHISTGGGASLEFLQGDILPGLDILREKRRS